MRRFRFDLLVCLLWYVIGAGVAGRMSLSSGFEQLLAAWVAGAMVLSMVSRRFFFWLWIGVAMGGAGAWRYHQVHGWKPRVGEISSSDGAIGVVRTAPLRRTASWRCEVELIGGADRNVNQANTGRAILYFQLEDSSAARLQWGDALVWTAPLEPLQSAKNPSAFDYADYQWKRGVLRSAFIRSDRWKLLQANSGRPPWLQVWRAAVEHYLYRVLDDEVAAVAMGFIMGDRSGIQQESVEAFSTAGAMHVMAVSGLHVGLVYGLLQGLVPRFFLRPLMVLLGVWFYAGITGFSASASRASWMISFVVIGPLLRRRNRGDQSLLWAAAVLLFIDPLEWQNLGFQLSFLAVAGILALQPLLQPVGREGWAPWRWLMGLISVSLAAQAATWPLSAHVFDVFPTYFLITNLWVIPYVSLLLYSGISVLCLSIWIHWQPLIDIWSGAVRGMIWTMHRVSEWPIASIRGLAFNEGSVGISYLLLFALFTAVTVPKFKRATLLCSYALLILWIGHRMNIRRALEKPQITFYSDRKVRVVGVTQDRSDLIFCFSDTLDLPDDYSYAVNAHRSIRGIRRSMEPVLASDGAEVWGVHILHLHPGGAKPHNWDGVDVVYWSGPWKLIPREWIENSGRARWVLHPSLPPWITSELVEMAIDKEIPYHELSVRAVLFNVDPDGHLEEVQKPEHRWIF